MKKYLPLIYFVAIYFLGAIPCSAEPAQVAASPAIAQKKIFFTFQVEATTNQDQAYAQEERLMDKGYPAYVEEVCGNTGETIYRIRVGKYQTQEDAENAARVFYEKEKKSYLIIAAQSAAAESSSSTTTLTAERSANPSQNEPPPVHSEKKEPQQAPAAIEKISKQEISPPLKNTPSPAVAEQQAPEAAVAEPAPVAAQSNSGWPPAVTRIYTYYDPQGYLRITNSAKKISDELQQKIESISIFPVKYLSFHQKKKVLVLDVAGKQEELQLSGIDFDTAAAVKNASAYFDKTIKDVPLRLKYSPLNDGDVNNKVLQGNLLFKQGTSLTIELLRQGIAPCDANSAPPSQKQLYIEAEARARNAKAGIWAEHAGAQ